MVATAIAIGIIAGTDWLGESVVAPQVSLVLPAFDPLVIVGLGIPLFIVTMAGQNVPGFVVLRTFGYERPPTRAILVATGAASAVGSLGGGYAFNLAAITAAIMAGPDAHPDPATRWIATFASGFVYLAIGLGAGVATALVAAAPPILIEAVAGLAVLGALVASSPPRSKTRADASSPSSPSSSWHRASTSWASDRRSGDWSSGAWCTCGCG